ncbi:MAG: DUF6503 family protein [Thermoanaerobaculia bacterium]|jgi:hypothetical protein
MRRILISVLLCWLPVARAERVEPVQELVDRSIAFHGGDLFDRSEISLRISSLSGTFSLTSRVNRGVFDHRVERGQGEEKHVVRVTNSGVSLIAGASESAVSGEEAERLRSFVFARIYFPFLPYRLNDPGVRKVDQGLETWEGRTLRRVKVTFDAGEGDEYLFWFDPKSARLEQLAYTFQTGKGGVRFRRASNYRRIGGILFYDAENFGLPGKGLSVDTVAPLRLADMERISMVEVREIHVRRLR